MESPTLNQFLQESKREFIERLGSGSSVEQWTVSVGNEAGDLDSLVSAIAFAYFSHVLDARNKTRHVPLVMTARTDLGLRPENEFALKSAGVNPAVHLVCIDDLPKASLPRLGGARLALVDHNAMLSTFASGAEQDDSRVAAIVDHHADEGRHLGASPRTIQVPTGSCASLVTVHFADRVKQDVPAPLADLLLSAILIDTNLKPSASGGKATETDLRAVEFLSRFSSFTRATGRSLAVTATNGDAASTTSALLQVGSTLLSKKFDVAWMTSRDLLRRDYKEYQQGSWRYGLATVPVGFAQWVSRRDSGGVYGWQGLERDCAAFMEERELDMLGVLTSFDVDKVAEDETMALSDKAEKKRKRVHLRELLVHVGTDERKAGALMRSVCDGLDRDDELQLGPWSGSASPSGVAGEGVRWKVWQQGNVKATRKQVAPKVKTLISAVDTDSV